MKYCEYIFQQTISKTKARNSPRIECVSPVHQILCKTYCFICRFLHSPLYLTYCKGKYHHIRRLCFILPWNIRVVVCSLQWTFSVDTLKFYPATTTPHSQDDYAGLITRPCLGHTKNPGGEEETVTCFVCTGQK